VSYIRDAMHYRDTLALLNTRNVANQLYADASFSYQAGNSHKFMLLLPVTIAWVDSATVSNTNSQNRMAVAVNYLFTGIRHLQIAANLRGEQVDDNSFLLPGINAAYALTQWLSVKANVQRTYRVPTLNELYYNPGGNPNLKPEQGWSVDGGYAIRTMPRSKLSFQHELSVFNRVIDNWILWFGGAIWTPHNIATVHSRGVETDNKLSLHTGKWQWHIGATTAYVLSTTTASHIAGDGSIGKQIPYAPRYNGQANIGFAIGRLYVNYNHTYTGYRFITVDESQWLMSYNTGNMQLLYTLPLQSNALQISAQCNNMWNMSYAVVNARPMPGINWLLGARLMIN
jgi:vitamin B12 transporter